MITLKESDVYSKITKIITEEEISQLIINQLFCSSCPILQGANLTILLPLFGTPSCFEVEPFYANTFKRYNKNGVYRNIDSNKGNSSKLPSPG